LAVEFKARDGVGFIALNRPPANSYDISFMEQLDGAIDAAAGADEVKAVIVRSASEKFFSAGADVKAFQQNGPEENMRMIERAHRALGKIGTIPKVFVAQISGHALGGGLEIALACDLRFGADDGYKLGFPEVTLGLLPGNGGTQRLPRLVGRARALDLMVTGRTLSPAEALEIGILDRLFPAGELEGKTEGFASTLVSGAVKAIGTIKLTAYRGLEGELEDGLALERKSIEELFGTEDAQEGIRAFAEKRKPLFTGK
jgi:enoyl-CoA hydratase/carnithine racemase